VCSECRRAEERFLLVAKIFGMVAGTLSVVRATEPNSKWRMKGCTIDLNTNYAPSSTTCFVSMAAASASGRVPDFICEIDATRRSL
jgi:hypothetical protein